MYNSVCVFHVYCQVFMRSLTRVISKQESGQLLSETQDTCYYCLCINFALYLMLDACGTGLLSQSPGFCWVRNVNLYCFCRTSEFSGLLCDFRGVERSRAGTSVSE